MRRALLAFLDDVCLISLDHDLNPLPGAAEDSGIGGIVALSFGTMPVPTDWIEGRESLSEWRG